MTKFLTCALCGETVERNSPLQKYCYRCAEKARLLQKKARYRETHQLMEEFMTCARCGKTTERHSGNQKYCPECKKAVRRQNQRESRLHQQQKEIERKRLGLPPKKPKRQKPAPGSLARVAQEARAAGMTYGAYTVAVQTGTLEIHLKRKGITDWPERLAKLD